MHQRNYPLWGVLRSVGYRVILCMSLGEVGVYETILVNKGWDIVC